MLFQSPNRLGRRGLRHSVDRRSSGKTPMVYDRTEKAKRLDIHGWNFVLFADA